MNRRDFSLRLAGAVGALSLGNTRVCAATLRSSLPGPQNTAALRVNGDRINQHLVALSEFGKNPYGGVSRVASSSRSRSQLSPALPSATPVSAGC